MTDLAESSNNTDQSTQPISSPEPPTNQEPTPKQTPNTENPQQTPTPPNPQTPPEKISTNSEQNIPLDFINKYRSLALRVIYYTKNRKIGEKIFCATVKFQEILDYFMQKLKDDRTFLKKSYFWNGKQIYPSDIMLYFCTLDPSLRLVEEDIMIEVEEVDILDDINDKPVDKIIIPSNKRWR